MLSSRYRHLLPWNSCRGLWTKKCQEISASFGLLQKSLENKIKDNSDENFDVLSEILGEQRINLQQSVGSMRIEMMDALKMYIAKVLREGDACAVGGAKASIT